LHPGDIIGQLNKSKAHGETDKNQNPQGFTHQQAQYHTHRNWMSQITHRHATKPEAGEHDLNAFQAIRNMDEILIANFMVFQEVLEQEHYDLVIADEAWDVDHYWL
jgi:hypothetical protein